MTSQHRNSGVLEKDQLTPKPLKIKKRLCPAREEHETTASASMPIITSNRSALVRYSGTEAARRSSLISLINEICELAQCDYPDDDFERNPTVSPATVPSQRGPAALIVRKTRRSTVFSESSTSNVAVNGSDDGSSPAHCTTLTRYRDTLDSHACADFNEARRVLLDTENIMRQLATPSSVSKPFLRHSYRSTSCTARLSSDHEDCMIATAVSKSSQQVLGRQSSFKLRYLNRLASGFDTMISASNLPDGDHCECKEPHERSGEVHDAQNRSCSDQDRIPEKLRCVTEPNSSLRSSFESDLESTIASFPSPPNSFSTILGSPNTIQTSPDTTQSALERYRTTRPRHSNSMSSEDARVVGVRLTLIPEKKRVVTANLEGGITFFVAVEIEGIVCRVSKDVYQPLDPNQLDLAVVIDNSLYTSPAALMSACESATAIAHSLTANSDRFALFQTSPDPKKSESSLKLLSLGEPNLWSLKHVLDNLEVCAQVPKPDCLGETIALAQSHLRSHPRVSSINNHGKEIVRQIIVLTSRPHTVASTSCSKESIGVHVICAGSLPWMSEKPLAGDGWYMNYQATSRELSTSSKLKDERRIAERFRHLIWMLRASSAPGVLSGLELFMDGGRFCTVKDILGPTKFETLRAGEVVKTIVNIQMSAPQVDADKISNPSHEKLKSSKYDKLTGVLDGVLEEEVITTLDARLQFTHSLLPGGIICHAKGEAKIKVVSSLPEPRNDNHWQESASHSEDLDPEEALVQKSLMYFLATTHTPASALHVLLGHFGTVVDFSICPEYLMQLLAELKYQRRVAARVNSFDTDINDCDHEKGAKMISSLKGSATPGPSVRPERWLHDDIDPFPEQNRRATIDLVADPPRGSVDLTRKYWTEIRKMGRGRLSSIMAFGHIRRSSRVIDEQRRIQEIAVRNGRSIGQESLDEMAYDSKGEENLAPWL
ncbi:hypothetical protein MMC17_004502 [Xylographa soralifera]|nr:hypothetical protein [Xylographa soralifera]